MDEKKNSLSPCIPHRTQTATAVLFPICRRCLSWQLQHAVAFSWSGQVPHYRIFPLSEKSSPADNLPAKIRLARWPPERDGFLPVIYDQANIEQSSSKHPARAFKIRVHDVCSNCSMFAWSCKRGINCRPGRLFCRGRFCNGETFYGASGNILIRGDISIPWLSFPGRIFHGRDILTWRRL